VQSLKMPSGGKELIV